MTKIITISQQKGGTGKTTTVINLGACLSNAGKKVLLVDIDPQANTTLGLGVDPHSLKENIYHLLTDFPKVSLKNVVVPTKWENLDLVPSHIDLSGVEMELANKIGRENMLRKCLKGEIGVYDFVLIDTPPSLSLLTVNTFSAAHKVLITVEAHPFSLDGLDKLIETIDMIRDEVNPTLSILGVLVTKFDSRNKISKAIMDRLKGNKKLKSLLFKTVIRTNIRLAECQDMGLPVIYQDKNCNGSKDYAELANEILKTKL